AAVPGVEGLRSEGLLPLGSRKVAARDPACHLEPRVRDGRGERFAHGEVPGDDLALQAHRYELCRVRAEDEAGDVRSQTQHARTGHFIAQIPYRYTTLLGRRGDETSGGIEGQGRGIALL